MIQTLFGSTEEKPSFLERMKEAVTRTRESLNERIDDLASIGKEIDRDTLDELEATLISADLGTATTAAVLETLRAKVDRKQIGDVDELKRVLKDELLKILECRRAAAGAESRWRAGSDPCRRRERHGQDYLDRQAGLRVACTGQERVAGGGRYVSRGRHRATGRSGATAPVSKSSRTSPAEIPSAVLFDALQAAKARKIDYVIVDTAGRLHTKSNLMTELEKMRRTAQRFIPSAPHETLLVMDATTGQNGLQQARLFTQSAGVTGIVLTKLDGTAKGGVVVAISQRTGSAGALRRRGREGRRPDCRLIPRTLWTRCLTNDGSQAHRRTIHAPGPGACPPRHGAGLAQSTGWRRAGFGRRQGRGTRQPYLRRHQARGSAGHRSGRRTCTRAPHCM